MTLNSPARFSASTLASRRLKNSGLRAIGRSEEHTSELQSQSNLVCRLLLEKKKKKLLFAVSITLGLALPIPTHHHTLTTRSTHTTTNGMLSSSCTVGRMYICPCISRALLSF